MALILLLLLSFSLFLSKSPLAASLSGDVISLLAFKTSLSRDSFNLLSNWNPTGNHCNWYGVVCDRISGRVVTISLPGGGLVGTLPPSIGNLTELRTLSLPNNVFSGEIPSEIMDFKYLETLELQGNNFSGSIPHQIRYLSSLRLLNFSHNSLSGSIPDDLIGLRRLGALDLSNNQLSSDIQVSKSHSCEFLNHLKLSNNYLIGNIPADIGKCINLRTFLVDGNIIEGQIPPEIGLIRQLRVLDVSRNSLTDGIPRELGNCKELSVVVLTNLVDFRSDSTGAGGEFNAFEGGIPQEVLLLPNLQIFWAPRANLGGGLNSNWNDSCSLRVLNLGQNYLSGLLPHSLEMCKYLTFLDLSSNGLQGEVPLKLQVPCMVHFNVSRNSLSGSLPRFPDTTCDTSLISFGRDAKFLDDEDIRVAYSNIPVWGTPASNLDAHLLVVHDFSWNDLFGTLPLLSFKNQFFLKVGKISYKLLMNNNRFNGSLPDQLLSNCSYLHSFSANLSVNQVSGALRPEMFVNCLPLTSFEAAQNHIAGSIPPEIGNLKMLKLLDLSRNSLSGAMPVQLGDCKDLEWINLAENNLSGAIPDQLGQLTSLQAVLLDHNNLSGEIPISFSTLPNLITLDLSFNNLSGHIPHLQHANNCDSYRGNNQLSSCPDSNASPTGLPTPLEVHNLHNRRKLKSLVIAISTAVSIVALILAVVVLVLFMGRRRRRLSKLSSLRRKMVVTFAETPIELNYDNVVGATGNFSIRNLIGTGGFGSTYKAELVPGFLVAVKRLSLGRFQGIQQFEAEIRTLGRIRHKNLVTLIGYYVGENEMFLVYNYLSGGNLESFIHERSGKNVEWPVIHKIAIDIARSLAFLHYSCVPRIVHRDIKPSNILLDEDCNAYLSDFGLARLLEVSETHATTDVAGTFGYVAPEYATTCRVSDKADVYSFGVVLLELMSGKKSLDPSFSEYGNGFNIVTWAKLLIKEGRYSELFAPQLWEAGPQEDLLGMMKLASTCTVESPLSVRPTMKQVLEKLKQLNCT